MNVQGGLWDVLQESGRMINNTRSGEKKGSVCYEAHPSTATDLLFCCHVHFQTPTSSIDFPVSDLFELQIILCDFLDYSVGITWSQCLCMFLQVSSKGSSVRS
jgi:hypothetical protein